MRTCHSCACTTGTLLRLTSAPTTFTAVLPMIAKQRSLCFERTAYEKRCLDFSRFEQLITMTRCCGSVCDSLGTHTYRAQSCRTGWIQRCASLCSFCRWSLAGKLPSKALYHDRPVASSTLQSFGFVARSYVIGKRTCGEEGQSHANKVRLRAFLLLHIYVNVILKKGTTRVSSMLRHAPRKTSSTHNRLPSLKTTMSRSRTNYK